MADEYFKSSGWMWSITLLFQSSVCGYDTIQYSILTCARKPTRVSLIYRTETTAKKCKTEKN